MPRVRAITLVLEDPSAAAMSLSRILGWTIDQDRGTFASLTSENSVPLWINAPTEGQDTSCNLILHIEADDVDVAFQRAVDNGAEPVREPTEDRKSTRLNSSHVAISYAVFCLKKKKKQQTRW